MSIGGVMSRWKATGIGALRREAGAMLVAFTVATMVLRLGGNIVLTRLLHPEAFGVVGAVTAFMVVLTMLWDLGFQDFVIRHERGDDPRFLDVIWTIRFGQSAVQGIVMLLAAWPVAQFLGKPELAMPIAATAPLFLLNGFAPLSLMKAQRAGRVRTLCTIELVALMIQIGSNLALTLIMPDYRALIVGLYVSSIARSLLALTMIEGRSRFAWDAPLAREFFGFSRWIMASTLLTLLITQSDKIIFVKLFTVAAFGVYMLPANLALAFQPFGRNYVGRYFYPLVARTWRESPDALAGLFYRARRGFYLLLFSGFGFAIGFAPTLFQILFDRRYEYGWIYFSVLMLRGALDLDGFTNVQTILATGGSRIVLHANLIRFVLFALWGLALIGPMGMIGLPLALVIAELGALLYSIVPLRRTGLFRPGDHALLYGAMILGALAGTAISLVFAQDVARAGLALLVWR